MWNLVSGEDVTPYAGVWIEMDLKMQKLRQSMVTPYAGVWIEIEKYHEDIMSFQSLPTRECGLK